MILAAWTSMEILWRFYAFERLLEQNRENFLGSYIESFLGAEEDSAEYQALCEGVCALMETRAD